MESGRKKKKKKKQHTRNLIILGNFEVPFCRDIL